MEEIRNEDQITVRVEGVIRNESGEWTAYEKTDRCRGCFVAAFGDTEEESAVRMCGTLSDIDLASILYVLRKELGGEWEHALAVVDAVFKDEEAAKNVCVADDERPESPME